MISVASTPYRATPMTSHSCPRCNGRTFRTRRRPIDRFFSRFVPVHRHCCESFDCRWEGNIRVDREALGPSRADVRALSAEGQELDSGLPWSFVMTTSVALAALVVMVSMIFELGMA